MQPDRPSSLEAFLAVVTITIMAAVGISMLMDLFKRKRSVIAGDPVYYMDGNPGSLSNPVVLVRGVVLHSSTATASAEGSRSAEALSGQLESSRVYVK